MIGKHFQRATLVLKEEFKTVWKKTRDTIIQNSVRSKKNRFLDILKRENSSYVRAIPQDIPLFSKMHSSTIEKSTQVLNETS